MSLKSHVHTIIKIKRTKMKIIKDSHARTHEQIKKTRILFNDMSLLSPEEFDEKYADFELPESCITQSDSMDYGNTLLHKLAEAGSANQNLLRNMKMLLQLCVECGVNVDVVNKLKMTPLHIAATLDESDQARLFLNAGANPNAEDCHGDTPLFLALYKKYVTLKEYCKSREAMASLLIKHGAEITPKIKELFKNDSVFAIIMREQQDKEIQELKAQVKELSTLLKKPEAPAPARNNFFGK